jgi:hypothetical protein
MTVNTTIEKIIYEGVDKISAVSKSAETSVKQLRQSLDAVKNVLGALGVTVGAGAMVTLAMETLKATAALDDMAESTGASVEGLSAIQRVARVGGHDFEGLTGQLGRMVKGLREGTEEGGKAAQAFAFLGVTTREADGRFRDTSQILLDLAQKLSRYEDGGNKVALVQDALGKGAERYLPLLKEMAEGTDLQATVTAKQAAEAEKLEKNINRLRLAMTETRTEMVASLTPAMIDFTDKVLEANRAGGLWLATLRAAAAIAGKAGGLGPIGLAGNLAAAGIDVATRSAPGPASQADVRRIENAFEQRPLTYQPPDEGRERRDRDFVARQLQEGLEEEQRIQAEAFQWTAFYADKKREAEKSQLDARTQAMIDFYDRDQELAIERGQAQIDADGLAHSLKLEMFRQALLTEEEAEIEAHERRLEELARFSDQELEILGGYQAVKEAMERAHRDRMNRDLSRSHQQLFKFMDALRDGDLQSSLGYFTSMTGQFSQHSKTMFELNKKAGIATAVLSGAVGVSRTLGSYPYPWNLVLAAAHAAVAALQVQAVRSASFTGDGGGAAPSLAGVVPATPFTPVESASPAQLPGQTVTIALHGGDMFTSSQIREMFERLNEAARNGMRLERIIVEG